jgi:hypothetical protein
MNDPFYQLAQINIARMRAPLADPLLAEFVAQLDRINALAEASPGFVWRLQSDSGNATDIRPFADDRILVNMSVWQSLETLHHYVYHSAHAGLFRRRQAWFEPATAPSQTLWWVAQGHIPPVSEGQARLALLHRLGPTPEAFTFKHHFPPPAVV